MPKKIALVTGASRGLGKAIAHRLADSGFSVTGTATTAEGAAALAKELQSISPDCEGKILNLREEESVEELFADLKERARVPAVLVANAGIAQDHLILRMTSEQWSEVIRVNLSGGFQLCRRALRGMMKNKWGRVILLGSVVGAIGNVGQANYAASKAGLAAMGRSLAREFAARGITVNTVSPGFIETDMTADMDEKMRVHLLKQIPLHRYGSPQEVAAAVHFLASEDAGYITGQTLHVNGGMYMV